MDPQHFRGGRHVMGYDGRFHTIQLWNDDVCWIHGVTFEDIQPWSWEVL